MARGSIIFRGIFFGVVVKVCFVDKGLCFRLMIMFLGGFWRLVEKELFCGVGEFLFLVGFIVCFIGIE